MGRDDDDILLFLSEVEDLLLLMENGLVKLEKEGFDRPSLDELFRAAHTIKGGSAMLGLSALAEATHLLEDVLDTIRAGRLGLDGGVLDVLFANLDWLSESRCRLARGEALEPNPALVGALRALLPGEDPVTGSESAPPRPSVPVHDTVLEINFEPNAPLLSVRAFQALMLLGECLEVAGSDPSIQEIEEDQCGSTLRLFLRGHPDHEHLAAVVAQLSDVVAFRVLGAEAPRAKEGDLARHRTVRVSVDLLDDLLALAGELVVDRARLSSLLTRLSSASLQELAEQAQDIAAHMGRLTAQLQEGIMRGRLVPLRHIFRKFPRMVRDLGRAAGKELDFAITGEGTELDRSVMELIDDPIVHLLRNAVDHGIEDPEERARAGKPPAGRVTLSARYAQSQVVITVADDGRGMDPERLRRKAVDHGLLADEVVARLSDRQALDLIFASGFSTASQVTEVSGRGVGLDVVRTNLRRINGRVEVETDPGRGTSLHLYLPLTLAIVRALLVVAESELYALPVSTVIEALAVRPADVHSVTGQLVLTNRNRVYPLVDLAALMGSRPSGAGKQDGYAVLVMAQSGVVALSVDSIAGEQEIVIKDLGSYMGQVPGVTGATILADGSLALIIDPISLLDAVGHERLVV